MTLSERSPLHLAELERMRIAGELHDGLIQWLIGAKLQVEAIASEAESGQPIDPQRLRLVLELLQRGLREGRLLIAGLQPPELRGGRWHALLRESFTSAAGPAEAEPPGADRAARATIEWRLAADTQPLPEEAALVLYRIAREAILNAQRHAAAERIEVEARCEADQVILEVRDDGRGFDPATVAPDHFGVSGMRQRAELVGGSLEIRSRIASAGTPSGTTVQLRLPRRRLVDLGTGRPA